MLWGKIEIYLAIGAQKTILWQHDDDNFRLKIIAGGR